MPCGTTISCAREWDELEPRAVHLIPFRLARLRAPYSQGIFRPADPAGRNMIRCASSSTASLLARDVTALVIGRRLPPGAWVPATLAGYSPQGQGRELSGGGARSKGAVQGAVVGGFSKRESTARGLRRAALSHRPAEGENRRTAHGSVGVRAEGEGVSSRDGTWSLIGGSARQAEVRRPDPARLQRAPSVFSGNLPPPSRRSCAARAACSRRPASSWLRLIRRARVQGLLRI